MLKCYIEGKNKVGSQERQYGVADGAVFIENYNETLDSGTIILPQLSDKIEIEPYDIAVVFSTDESNVKIKEKRMCVDTITCTQTSLDPAIYKYEITLFSLTKLLEGVVLPSLSITKLLTDNTGYYNGNNTRKIKFYLDRYLDEYCPKTHSSASAGAYGNKYVFSDRVNAKFPDVECPELQWNEPTLREVFTDLMMVADCIPIVVYDEEKGYVIDCIDISATGSEITGEQKKSINYIVETQSSEDYVSGIKMKLSNVANNSLPTNQYSDFDENAIPKDKTIIEETSFRNSERYIITDETVVVETSFPIWNLFYVECYAPYSATVMCSITIAGQLQTTDVIVNGYAKVVLKSNHQNSDYILEYSEWQTKNILYNPFGNTQPLSTDYQNTCLYYKRGTKGIHNFNAKQQYQALWISGQTSVLELITRSKPVEKAAREKAEQLNPGFDSYVVKGWNDLGSKIRTCMFRVAYEPIDDCCFIASKRPMQSNERIVVDNQTNSYVDIKRQGMLEYLKANRLGNKIKTANGRYKTDETNMPSLADKINGSIIFQKQIEVHENFINVNYRATDNYVLKDYFTSVKSKIRSWKVISGNEAFVRADLIKFYVNKNIASVNETDRVIPVYQTLEQYLSKFKHCIVQFDTSEGWKPYHNIGYANQESDIDGFLVEFSKHISGNSVLFTFRMFDNSAVGKYVYNLDGTGGSEQKDAYYTDKNGETLKGFIYFYENAVISSNDATRSIDAAVKPGVNIARQFSGLVAKIPFVFSKDNKEITQITVQIEMNDEANDMFIGKV